MPSRTLRYSGSDRPAWRMNHTGVCGTGSRRQARRNAESCGGGFGLLVHGGAFVSTHAMNLRMGRRGDPPRPGVLPHAEGAVAP